MTVLLDGAGGVLTRIGALYRWIKANRTTGAGSSAAGQFPYELIDLYEEYSGATNAVQAAIERIALGVAAGASALEQLNAVLKSAAENTLIEMVDADDPLPDRTVAESLRVLIEQMIAESESVAANTVTVSATAGTGNVGDGFLVSDNKDSRGRELQCAIAEDVLFERNATSPLQFSGRGEVATASRLACAWPLGSGCSQVVTAADADSNDGHVTNGSFNAFTTNAPDGWSIVVGSAGTQILEETTTVLAGAAALEIVGNGSTLTQIRQNIVASLESRVPVFCGVFAKVDVVPAAGVLTIDLFDGTNVITDDEGNAQSFAIALTGLTTAWSSHGAIFRIADPLPAAVYLRVRLSTALSTGSSLFLDNLTVEDATRLYEGGPFVGLVAGGTPFGKDDTHLLTVANNRTSVYQEAVEVLFGSPELDELLPISGSPTITNSLPSY